MRSKETAKAQTSKWMKHERGCCCHHRMDARSRETDFPSLFAAELCFICLDGTWQSEWQNKPACTLSSRRERVALIARLCLTAAKYSLRLKLNCNPMIVICPITSFSCFLPVLCMHVCVCVQRVQRRHCHCTVRCSSVSF